MIVMAIIGFLSELHFGWHKTGPDISVSNDVGDKPALL